MLQLTKKFFELQLAPLIEDDKQIIKDALTAIYHDEPIEYCGLSDFICCKNQLLTLLNYYIAQYPELRLFQVYKETKVAPLSKEHAGKDIEITLKSAKNCLESYFLEIEKKYHKIDKNVFNHYDVKNCYSGAYSNLVHALTHFHCDTFSSCVYYAKRELLFNLACHYLNITNNLQKALGNEIHNANALYNAFADSFSLDKQEDGLVSMLSQEDIDQFAEYLEGRYDVCAMISMLISLIPLPPNELLDADHDNYKSKAELISDFFQMFGAESPTLAQLQQLYLIEEGMFSNQFFYRLRPKEQFNVFSTCFLIHYLEEQGYITGSQMNIADIRLLNTGDTIVEITQTDNFQTLTQEALLLLVEYVREKDWFMSLLKQMNVESLVDCYDRNNILPFEDSKKYIMQALLETPCLSEKMLRFIDVEIDVSDRRLLLDYVFMHDCHFLNHDFLNKLTKELSRSQLVNYAKFAIIHNGLSYNFQYFYQYVEQHPDDDCSLMELFAEKMISPLSLAAKYGALDILIFLLQKAVSLSQDGYVCEEPLTYIIAVEGHANILPKLKNLGVSFDMPGYCGTTPAYVAASLGHVKVLQELKALGANLDTPNYEGATPAFVAAQHGYLDVVKLFSDRKTLLSQPFISSQESLILFARQRLDKELEDRMIEKIKERMKLGDEADAIALLPRDIAFVMRYHQIVEYIDGVSQQMKMSIASNANHLFFYSDDPMTGYYDRDHKFTQICCHLI